MAKGKRKTMDEALARMGEMNATRPTVEPETVVEPVQAVEADPTAGMSLEETGAAANAAIRAEMERRDRERAEYNAARARGENPPLPPGVIDGRRRRKVETVAESAPTPVAVVAPETRAEPVSPAKAETGSTRARSHVEKERRAQQTRPAVVPRGYNVRPPRIEKPHQSIYADPAVFKVIRQIAAQEDVKPQDLYREALRMMLKRYGYSFDKLDRGETD